MPVALRIGISSLDVAALPIYADATGEFERSDLAAEIVRDLGHPDRVRDAVVGGELDAGYVDIVTALDAKERLPIEIVAPGGLHLTERPIVTLVQAPWSKLKDGSGLAGKTVVTPGRHDLARLGVRAWIDATGGDAGAVRFRNGIPMASVSAVLASGEVDACVISEPQRTLQHHATKPLAVPFDAIAPRFLMGAYIASKRWLQMHADGGAALATVLRRTAAWANGHQAETGAILAAGLGFSPTLVASMTRATYAEEFSEELIEPVRRAAAAYG